MIANVAWTWIDGILAPPTNQNTQIGVSNQSIISEIGVRCGVGLIRDLGRNGSGGDGSNGTAALAVLMEMLRISIPIGAV